MIFDYKTGTLASSEPDRRRVNEAGWTLLANSGCSSSQPFGPRHFSHAREMLDPRGKLPWKSLRTVLCLAAGGGQQAALFASLGCEVVSADFCEEQLRRDEQVALKYGFAIECIRLDMVDLSALYGCKFDLVFQAISSCYVSDVRQVYREVAKVVRPAGLYRVDHWNPMHLQLSHEATWNGRAYEVARPQVSGTAIEWRSGASSEVTCLHFMHSLGDLLGGLCQAGFSIIDFDDRSFPADLAAEPGSNSHLAGFIPPFLTVLSRAEH